MSRKAPLVTREIGCDGEGNTDDEVVETTPLVFDGDEKHFNVVRYCTAPGSSNVRVKVAAYEKDVLFDDHLGKIEGDLGRGKRLSNDPKRETCETNAVKSRLWAAVE